MPRLDNITNWMKMNFQSLL